MTNLLELCPYFVLGRSAVVEAAVTQLMAWHFGSDDKQQVTEYMTGQLFAICIPQTFQCCAVSYRDLQHQI